MADLPREPFDGADDNSEDNSEDKDAQNNPFAGTPFEALFGGDASGTLANLGDPSAMQAMFAQLQRMFAPHDGAVNWDVTRDLARQVVAQQPDRSPDAGDQARVADAARLAEHWLDSATEMPAASSAAQAWSRAEWVEASMPAWKRLVEPVAESVVAAMSRALPAEAAAMAGPMLGMLNQLGGALFSQQIGQAVGGLSEEVVSSTDIGFPVTTDSRPAIVVSNATAFGDGLGISESDVLLYLVLRECAHQRLYAHAPWLREHLFGLIEEYGRGMTIDMSAIQSQLQGIDPSNPEALQDALTGGMFDLEQSPAQQAALGRLETILALVEGWVDDVVGQATEKAMPQAQALREAVRRRRATGGPAEETFAALVGLELRPRRLRDAAALWGALRAADGPDARDAVWAHHDLLPKAADLDDPLAFAQRTKAADDVDVMSDEFDAQLQALLDEGTQDDAPVESDGQQDSTTAGEGNDGAADTDPGAAPTSE